MNRVSLNFSSVFVLLLVFFFMITPSLAKDNDIERVLAESRRYQLVLRTTSDGQGGVVVLTEEGRLIDSSEDIFYLISKCPDEEDRKTLLSEYVGADILSHGGADAYQQLINENLKRFGDGFYSFLSKSAVSEYQRRGIFFGGETDKRPTNRED